MSAPLISCAMVTRNRPEFACQAIWYFLRQDYAEKELIVVDDGEYPVGHLLPRDERIRYLHLNGRASLSHKRNIACEISRGDVIAHWSEVDWIGPQRLTLQLEELQAHGADVCGLGDLLHYCIEAGQAWSYTSPPAGRPWLVTDTLLYQRSVWSAHPFDETAPSAAPSFLRELPAHRIRTIGSGFCYVSIILPGERGMIEPRDPAWRRRAIQEVTDRIGWDQPFYGELRLGTRRLQSRRPVTGVTLAAPFLVYDGIGSMAEYLALGMSRAGTDVNVVPFRCDRSGLTAELQELLDRSRPDFTQPALCFGWLGENLQLFKPSSDLFINTMWETSRIPPRYVDKLNGARAVIVPTTAVARAFRASGITVPIEVVAQGVDPDMYGYEDRPEREELTTLMVGSYTPRKNFEQGITAWKQAFGDAPLARLIIKSRFGYHRYVPDDPRITFVDSEETTRGISHWYRNADVLMALGNEGFGLPLIEGMATGLPVIALDAEGQSDVCAEARDCVFPVHPDRYEPYDDPYFGSCGVRSIPAISEIVTHLRWIASHRAEARTVGRAASQWILQHRNVWAMGPAMLQVMEHHLKPSRPLRRFITLWRAPGRDDRLADVLAERIPALHVTVHPPDLRSTRVLHVQYQDGLFDETELTRYIQQATYAGIPVVVSERRVGPHARAWEREATVLVASSSSDAAQLHARWPHKHVELLDVGDPHRTANRHLALWTALAHS